MVQYLVQFLNVMTFICAELVGVAQAKQFIKSHWICFCVFSCFFIWKPRSYIVSKSWKSLRLPNIVIRARNGIIEFGKLPGWGSRLEEDYQSFKRNLWNIPQENEENQKITTCNRLDSETLGFDWLCPKTSLDTDPYSVNTGSHIHVQLQTAICLLLFLAIMNLIVWLIIIISITPWSN